MPPWMGFGMPQQQQRQNDGPRNGVFFHKTEVHDLRDPVDKYRCHFTEDDDCEIVAFATSKRGLNEKLALKRIILGSIRVGEDWPTSYAQVCEVENVYNAGIGNAKFRAMMIAAHHAAETLDVKQEAFAEYLDTTEAARKFAQKQRCVNEPGVRRRLDAELDRQGALGLTRDRFDITEIDEATARELNTLFGRQGVDESIGGSSSRRNSDSGVPPKTVPPVPVFPMTPSAKPDRADATAESGNPADKKKPKTSIAELLRGRSRQPSATAAMRSMSMDHLGQPSSVARGEQ